MLKPSCQRDYNVHETQETKTAYKIFVKHPYRKRPVKIETDTDSGDANWVETRINCACSKALGFRNLTITCHTQK
jgi:hypothetical protein